MKDKQMYTKACKISGYTESIYQGGSIFMKYDLNEYKDLKPYKTILIGKNFVLQNLVVTFI